VAHHSCPPTFVLSCQSVRPNGIPQFLLDGFSYLNIFSKNLSRKLKFHYNLTTITGTLHEDRYTFLIISRSVLLRMRNVSDKSCTENQNTHFTSNNVFPKIVPFMRKCGKTWYSPDSPHTTIYGARALHAGYLRLQNTHPEHATLIAFHTAAMAAPTRLNIALHYSLPCPIRGPPALTTTNSQFFTARNFVFFSQ
jgi:hypothetical protein